MRPAGRGTFDDIVALAPAHEPVLRALRALVEDVHPDATEVGSPGERAVYWGWGEAKMTESYAYAIPHARYVNLGFFQGAHLPDPDRRLEGTGKVLRHVKVRSPDEAAHPSIRALLLAARDERRAALNRLGAKHLPWSHHATARTP